MSLNGRPEISKSLQEVDGILVPDKVEGLLLVPTLDLYSHLDTHDVVPVLVLQLPFDGDTDLEVEGRTGEGRHQV